MTGSPRKEPPKRRRVRAPRTRLPALRVPAPARDLHALCGRRRADAQARVPALRPANHTYERSHGKRDLQVSVRSG